MAVLSVKLVLGYTLCSTEILRLSFQRRLESMSDNIIIQSGFWPPPEWQPL